MFDYINYQKKWRLQNKDKLKANHIKHRYGTQPDEYKKCLEATMCSICGQGFKSNKDKHYDHDHITKRFRGVLCLHCNLGLGHFKDNKDVLYTAINYLIEADEKEKEEKRIIEA